MAPEINTESYLAGINIKPFLAVIKFTTFHSGGSPQQCDLREGRHRFGNAYLDSCTFGLGQ